MASLPTPRFAVGDTIFYASYSREARRFTCPDCLGSRLWSVKTPAGTEFETPCQRCWTYGPRDLPPLGYFEYAPRVSRLTVGSIRIDTNHEDAVEYMCRETGVGSGTLYSERDCFADEASAFAAATTLAASLNDGEAGRADLKQLEAREYALLPLTNALELAARSAARREIEREAADGRIGAETEALV